MSYLVVNKKSYTLLPSAPSKPYLNVSKSYLKLSECGTVHTTGLKVKQNGKTYMPVTTTTYQATYYKDVRTSYWTRTATEQQRLTLTISNYIVSSYKVTKSRTYTYFLYTDKLTMSRASRFAYAYSDRGYLHFSAGCCYLVGDCSFKNTTIKTFGSTSHDSYYNTGVINNYNINYFTYYYGKHEGYWGGGGNYNDLWWMSVQSGLAYSSTTQKSKTIVTVIQTMTLAPFVDTIVYYFSKQLATSVGTSYIQ